jgi:organic hydroperoxide reductase OsmC/OhrA
MGKNKEHRYTLSMIWTGNKGEGTSNYRSYERDYRIESPGKHSIEGSSDPSFRGSPRRYNPEELFLSSIAACHMLWYLHLCSDNQIVVTDYQDQPLGIMTESSDGGGHFKEVVLKPLVTLTDGSMIPKAIQLHDEANKMCFLANSCNFPIRHDPRFRTLPGTNS